MTNRPLARLNTVLVFADSPPERHLERYRRAGFAVSEHVAEWDPGLRNGFVDLWPEDLEILTVADEEAFERDADTQLRAQRASKAVHAVELYSDDVHAVREQLIAAGIEAPEIVEGRLTATAADAQPDFYFLDLPHLPGTAATVITSTFPNPAMRRYLYVAPNGVFGLGGVTIAIDDPVTAGQAWASVVEPGMHDLAFRRTAGMVPTLLRIRRAAGRRLPSPAQRGRRTYGRRDVRGGLATRPGPQR
ncbi:MAG: VOC family protein [Cumulibacter sp.]